MQMDIFICETFLKIYTEGGTSLFVELIIFADGYDHLHNFLFNLWRRWNLSICWANHICRWIWSSVKLIGCSIQMDEIICTCIYVEFISVQMDTFICTYTSLVLNYWQIHLQIYLFGVKFICWWIWSSAQVKC